MTPEVALGPKESLALFNTLSHEQQLAIMTAHTRLARCMACPKDWPLAHKVGVADLCSGKVAAEIEAAERTRIGNTPSCPECGDQHGESDCEDIPSGAMTEAEKQEYRLDQQDDAYSPSEQDRHEDALTEEHTRDSDCTVGEDGMCEVCGVLHGDPCQSCGGKGFHVDGYVESDVHERPDLPHHSDCVRRFHSSSECTCGKDQRPETIDLTPVGCQTPEGNARVAKAQQEWDSATHDLANTLKRVIEEIFDRDTDKIARAEYYSELQTLIRTREAKQNEFLRAICAAPEQATK